MNEISDLSGKIDFQGKDFGEVASEQLATPIRRWFMDHPEEIDAKNHFFVSFDQQQNGKFRCYLDLMGRHHWHAVESGNTLPLALRNTLESAVPDVVLENEQDA